MIILLEQVSGNKGCASKSLERMSRVWMSFPLKQSNDKAPHADLEQSCRVRSDVGVTLGGDSPPPCDSAPVNVA